MPRAIPVLGYPSMSAAAAALRDEGRSWREVAALLGPDVTVARASALAIAGWRRTGARLAREPARRPKDVTVTIVISLSEDRAPSLSRGEMRRRLRDEALRIIAALCTDGVIARALDEEGAS